MDDNVKKAVKHLIDAHAELVRAISRPEGEDTAGELVNAEYLLAKTAEALGCKLLASDVLYK